MTDLRERWVGVVLSGEYTLEQWLAGDERASFFQTSLPDGRRAVVKLAPETVVDGGAPLDLWRRTRQLRHPNLIELFDCGRTDRFGETVFYAIFESSDDTLAAALGRSPLTPQESREVLDSVLSALRYLHAQGLVASALDSGNIVGVGDRIKLATDALREADSSSAYREDVRVLGELWKDALMSASPRSAEIAAHAADPDPQTRWTLAEIEAELNPPPTLPAFAPPAPAAGAMPVSAPQVPASPISASPAVPVEAPAGPMSRAVPSRIPAPRFAKLIFAGAAGVALLILVLNWPRLSGVSTPSPVASVSLPAQGPPAEVAAAPPLPKVAAPEGPVPAPPKVPAGGKEAWRVIVFTFRTRDAAARKVQQLNQHHPGLNAGIFSPKDKKDYYLVSLGGRMTHEDAVRVQRSARGKGLPRDIYVQNYAE